MIATSKNNTLAMDFRFFSFAIAKYLEFCPKSVGPGGGTGQAEGKGRSYFGVVWSADGTVSQWFANRSASLKSRQGMPCAESLATTSSCTGMEQLVQV